MRFVAHDDHGAAMRLLDAFERAFRELAANPGLGHRRSDLTRRDLRFWSVYAYLIVYDPNADPIRVARVLHGRRDVRSTLASARRGQRGE